MIPASFGAVEKGAKDVFVLVVLLAVALLTVFLLVRRVIRMKAEHDQERDYWLEEIDGVRKCPSSNKWDRCLVFLRACFAHHFHITRRVVDSANGVSRWSFV